MNTFVAEVSDSGGRLKRIVRESTGAEVLARALETEGWFVITVGVAKHQEPAQGRLTRNEVIQITKTLAQFLDNGLPMVNAVTMARGLAQSPRQKAFWASLAVAIDRGESLFQGLSNWKSSFSPLYLGLVQIGEQAGSLSEILGRLATYLDAKKTLADKTANAMIYPCIVLVVALLGLVGLLFFVLPPLTEVVRSIQPVASQGYRSNLDRVAGNLAIGLGVVVVATVLGSVAWVARARSEPWKRWFDRQLWSIPGIRGMVQTAFGLHASFAMETLLLAGYPVEVAVGETAQVIENRWAGLALLDVQRRLRTGMGLVEAFRKSATFPETFLLWVALGEASNDLTQSFRHLRIYYQQTWETQQSRLISLVEPGLILVVGVIMIVLVLTFITPVFALLGGLL